MSDIGIRVQVEGAAQGADDLDKVSRSVDGVGRSSAGAEDALDKFATKMMALASAERIASALSEWTQDADRLGDAMSVLGERSAAAGEVMGLRLVPSLDIAIARGRMLTAELDLTDQQMDAVALAGIRFAQANGVDAAQGVSQLTSALISGRTRGLQPFGIELQEGADRAENQAAALAALTRAAGANRQAIQESIGTLDIYEGAWTKLKERIGQTSLAMLDLPFESIKEALTGGNGVVGGIDRLIEGMIRLEGSMHPGVINRMTSSLWSLARAAAAAAGAARITDLPTPGGPSDLEMHREVIGRRSAGGPQITREAYASTWGGRVPVQTDMTFTLDDVGAGQRRGGGGGGGGGNRDIPSDMTFELSEAEGFGRNQPGGTGDYSGSGYTVPIGGSSRNPRGALPGANPGGTRGLGARGFAPRDETSRNLAEIASNADRTGESLSRLGEIGTMALGALTSAVESNVAAWVAGEKSIGAALAGILKQTLMTIATEATVKAVMATAEGLFLLATSMGTNPMAEVAFASAAEYAAVAALAGGGAAAMSAAGKGGGSRRSSSSGGSIRSSGGAVRDSGGSATTMIQQFILSPGTGLEGPRHLATQLRRSDLQERRQRNIRTPMPVR